MYLKELAMKLPLNHIANSVDVSPKDIQPELIDFAKLEEELKKIWKSTQ